MSAYYDELTLKTIRRITLEVDEIKKIVENQKNELLKIIPNDLIRSEIDKNLRN